MHVLSHRRRSLAIAASAALTAMAALFVAGPASAQDAPAPVQAAPAADDAQIFARITLAPLDRVDATLARGGLPGVGDRLANLIAMLQIVGPQQVDRTRGASIAFVAGEQLTRDRGTIISVPLKPDALPIASITKMGAQAVPGHADAAAMGNVTFRRGDAYLIFGGHQPSVLGVAPAEIDAGVRDPSSLLRADLDFRTARAVAPQGFEALLVEVTADKSAPPATNEAAAADAQAFGDAFRDTIANFFRRLDTMNVALISAGPGGAPAQGGGEALTLDVAFAPITFKAAAGPAALPRPAFPAGIVGRVDWAYPARDALPKLVPGIVASMQRSKPFKSPEHEADTVATLTAMAELLVGDTVSLAHAQGTGGPAVLYGVIQWAGDAKPLAARLDAFDAAVARLSRHKDKPFPMKRSSYVEGGATFARYDFLDDAGQRQGSIDLAEQDGGRRVLIAVADDPGHHLPAFATLRAEPGAPLTRLVEAEVDLPAVKKLIGELPPGTLPAAGTWAALLDKVGTTDRLTITADGDGQTFRVRTALPLKLIAALLSMT
jgi:hypothetical protein